MILFAPRKKFEPLCNQLISNKNISYLQFYVVAGSKVQKMLNKLKFIVQLGLLYTFNSSLLCRSNDKFQKYCQNYISIESISQTKHCNVRNRNKSGNILNSTICIDRRQGERYPINSKRWIQVFASQLASDLAQKSDSRRIFDVQKSTMSNRKCPKRFRSFQLWS